MAQIYPYYVVARIDAGQMVKIFHDKKFNSYMAAVDAMNRKYESLRKVYNRNIMEDSQIVILEYTKQYQGKICTIYSFNKRIQISDPEEAI